MDFDTGLHQIEAELVFKESDPVTRLQILKSSSAYMIRFARKFFKEELEELVNFEPIFYDWILLYTVLYAPDLESLFKFYAKENPDYIKFMKALDKEFTNPFWNSVFDNFNELRLEAARLRNVTVWNNLNTVGYGKSEDFVNDYTEDKKAFDENIYRNLLWLIFENNIPEYTRYSRRNKDFRIDFFFGKALLYDNSSALKILLETFPTFDIERYLSPTINNGLKGIFNYSKDITKLVVDFLISHNRVTAKVIRHIYINEEDEDEFNPHTYMEELVLACISTAEEMMKGPAISLFLYEDKDGFKLFISLLKSKFPNVKLGNLFFENIDEIRTKKKYVNMIRNSFDFEEDFDLNTFSREDLLPIELQDYLEKVYSL